MATLKLPSNPSTPLSFNQLAQLWVNAGGPSSVANIMAAIALAESSGHGGPSAVDHDADGSTDYGWWQINSVHGYDSTQLLNNALYNAKAAVAVYKSSGLGAWTTYTSGAYLTYLNGGTGSTDTPGITRPGGATSDTDGVDAWLTSITTAPSRTAPANVGSTGSGTQTVGIVSSLTAPFTWALGQAESTVNSIGNTFTGAADAISDVGDFLKFIAWIFNPVNILRAVEFLSGLGLMALGFHAVIQTSRGSGGPSAASRIVNASPIGRAREAARAQQSGRSEARRAERNRSYQRNYKKGRRRTERRQYKRSERKLGRRERPPF